MRTLLDTCVLSELVRPRPDAQVVGWLDLCVEDQLFLSVLTFGELRKGIAKLSDARRRETLRRWVEGELAARFDGRVLPVSAEIAARWGTLSGEAERRGETLPVIDALLAATALTHNLVVATRNTRDLARAGAETFNPWGG